MQPFQQRVADERFELNKKIEKLGSFLSTEMFNQLPADEKFRLRVQYGVMQTYQMILDERIADFTS